MTLRCLAEKWNCLVEVVENRDDLATLGNVGCLLRYRPDRQNEKHNDILGVVVIDPPLNM